jgi:intein/homing endonuclease
MFEKSIQCSVFNYFDVTELEKVASTLKESLSGEIKQYIRGIKPDKNSIFLLATPMGASEYYGCFPEHCKVLTKNGRVPISEVSETDMVYTHKNRFRKVTKKFKHPPTPRGKAIIKLAGIAKDLEATVNHPYLVIPREEWAEAHKLYVYCKSGELTKRKKAALDSLTPKWIAAKDLKWGDRIISPINTSTSEPTIDDSVPEDIKLTPYLCGMYAAEGCTVNRNRNGIHYPNRMIVLVTNAKETSIHSEIKNEAKKLGSTATTRLYKQAGLGIVPEENNACRQTICNKSFVANLVKFVGRKSKNKFVHDNLLSLPYEWKKEFLRAYFLGDGCVVKGRKQDRGSLKASSASQDLAIGIQRMLWSIGIPASTLKSTQRSQVGYGNDIYYIHVGKCYSHLLGFPKAEWAGHSTMTVDLSVDSNQAYVLVKEVSFGVYDVPTYNIEVEKDNSYITDDFITHNSNNNSDEFTEEALNPPPDENGVIPTNYGYKTFENTPARVYFKHDNKNPSNSMGEVVKSAYNQDMHRVEVIMRLDRLLAPDIIDTIERAEEKRASGEQLSEEDSIGISMGCRLLDGDVCSVCGNRSRSKLEYCEHLRDHLGTMDDNGRKIAAINPKPVFFDLSIVSSPAARESAILKKVASDLSDAQKEMTISEIRTYYTDENPRLKSAKSLIRETSLREKRIPIQTLQKIAGTTDGFMNMVNTFNVLGIVLKPEEFQYIALSSGGHQKLATQYNQHTICFPETTSMRELPVDTTCNIKSAETLSKYMYERSAFDPFLSLRMMSKTAGGYRKKHKNFLDNPLLLETSRLYNGYRSYLLTQLNDEKLAGVIDEHPQVLKWYLETENPMIKMASISGYGTKKEIVSSMLGTVPKLYLILS